MKFKFPKNWSNESEISNLFAPLPENDNLERFEKSVRYWRIAIRHFATQSSQTEKSKGKTRRIAFTKRHIKNHFYHPKIGRPLCITQLLNLFSSNKTICRKSVYFSSKKSQWLNWAFPFLQTQNLPARDEIFFYKDILEKIAGTFYEDHLKSMRKYTDCIVINVDEKAQMDCDWLHKEDLELILLYLERHGKVALPNKNKGKLICFYKVLTTESEKTFSQLDERIAKLKFAKKTLKMQVDYLMLEIEKKTKIVKELASKGKRNVAIAVLKIKKNLESVLDSRINNLNNLALILLEINSLYINILTFDGLKVGTEILTSLNSNLNLKKIDDSLIGIGDIIEKSDEVGRTLSTEINREISIDEDELLAELEKENNTKKVEKKSIAKGKNKRIDDTPDVANVPAVIDGIIEDKTRKNKDGIKLFE